MNRFLTTLIGFCIIITLNAQEEVLLSIGDKTFTKGEFNYIYEKNNSLTQNPISKEEYVEFFVNYKLKVEEAIAQGYDTMPSFQQELNYYHNELAKPYLTDKKATEDVVKEAYEHMCYEVDASHILIKLPPSPSPQDTLEAYTRIAEIKQQLNNGADFDKLTVELSEGPSAPNKGRLGYFGAFMMVYPFEKAAYNTPVGEVSEITRTSFGYHLIKAHDKRKNRGEILVAHIMKLFPYGANENIQTQIKVEADEIYRKLEEGESFNELVKQYSDDKQTIDNNGQLPWFGTGKMVPEFTEAAFALTEDGQYSKPVKTKFGWHIIKRIDSRPVRSLDECRPEILNKIKRDERAYAGKNATIERLRSEYNYKLDVDAYEQQKKKAIEASKKGKSEFTKIMADNRVTLASFADVTIVSNSFIVNAFPYDLPRDGLTESSYDLTWKTFINNKILDYEKSQLKYKYPDYKYLMNEYHDGLLIFEISQNEVWNKASNDTVGLAAFYEANKNNYLLDEHFDGRLIFCKDKKTYKSISKLIKKDSDLKKDSIDADLSKMIEIKEGRFFKGDEPLLDKQVWKVKNMDTDGEYQFLVLDGEIKKATTQKLDEIRGQVISEYQNELEEKWLIKLKEKHQPRLNTVAL